MGTAQQRRGARLLMVARSDRFHDFEMLASHLERWLGDLPGSNLELERTTDRSRLSGDLTSFDVVCSLLRLGPEASEEEERAIVGFTNSGGGLLGVHGGLVLNRPPEPPLRPGMVELWGARFAQHAPYGPFTVRIVDHNHPITRGLSDFEVRDELFELEPLPPLGAHVLAEADAHGVAQPMAYTKSHGRGSVYYCALGHDTACWDHPAYQHLMTRGVGWLAAQALRARGQGG